MQETAFVSGFPYELWQSLAELFMSEAFEVLFDALFEVLFEALFELLLLARLLALFPAWFDALLLV
jgi:hypothetical protein